MNWSSARTKMVERQIVARGVRDQRVLNAMRQVPREWFVPANVREHACQDGPLPIAAGQTISQPYVVALMIDSLELTGEERVLDIGTGSGYTAAVLATIAREVFTVERIANLATQAEFTLRRLNYQNVLVQCGDGSRGWPEQSPFDAILVSAGAPRVPESLKLQLKTGGRMVLPVGSDTGQHLILVQRLSASRWKKTDLGGVRFVPLIGGEGWSGGVDP